MATDKRSNVHSHVYQLPRGMKRYEASVAIQLPTTSANLDSTRYDSDNCHRQSATGDQYLASLADNYNSSSMSAAHSNSSNNLTQANGHHTPPPHYHEIPGVVPAYQGRSSGPPPSYDEVINPNVAPPSYQSLFGQVSEARKTSNGLVDLLRQLFLILIGTLGCTIIIGFLLIIPVTMILVGFFYLNDCRAENIPSFLVIGGVVWIVKNVLNCFNQFKRDSFTSNRPPPRRTPISTMSTSNHPNTSVIIDASQNSSINSGSSTNLGESNQTISRGHTIQLPGQAQRLGDNASRHRGAHSRVSQQSRVRRPSLIGITSFKCESMLNYFLIVWFLAGCIVVYRIYEPDYENPLSNSYCHKTVYLYAFWLMTSAFVIMAVVLSCLCCLMVSSIVSCSHNR